MGRGRHVCRCSDCRKDAKSRPAEFHKALNEVLFHADEKNRRLIAAMEALRMGWGGIRKVSRITGLPRRTISRGMQEMREGRSVENRIRHPGGGRPKVEKKRREGSGEPQEADGGRDRRRSDFGDQVEP